MFWLMEEWCDDGNLMNGDGCDQNCWVEDGFVCEDEIDRVPLECHWARTGVTYTNGDDATVVGFYDCPPRNPFTDEFNPGSQDGAPLVPDVCKEECGDRWHFHQDGCDDGNWDNWDGCDR